LIFKDHNLQRNPRLKDRQFKELKEKKNNQRSRKPNQKEIKKERKKSLTYMLMNGQRQETIKTYLSGSLN